MHMEVLIFCPSNSLSSGSGSQVIANPNISTTYMMVAIDSCSSDTAYFNVTIPNDTFTYVMTPLFVKTIV